ncbi:S8 family peptidase [Oscillibacter sp. ER4]|uniref:S8 family peptidase n=1 Tax=Oscillibacter sp. ER4 TaxID=1519439 RepID=UPI00051C58BE|nr:S8 family peptidase [Oscillibacter sp. ER4]
MNDILLLKGRFEQRSNTQAFGPPVLPKGKTVSSAHVRSLQNQLKEILKYWKEHREIAGALVSVHYKHVVAKSNRIRILLADGGKMPADSIRGAKFAWDIDGEGKEIQKHVFTHYVSLRAIERAVEYLGSAADVIDAGYAGEITATDTERIAVEKDYVFQEIIKRTSFLGVVLDCHYVESFNIDRVNDDILEESIVTIYKTRVETKALLAKFGINIYDDRIIDETTIRLTKDEIRLLLNNASYLIAMNVVDMSELTKDDIIFEADTASFKSNDIIPSPQNEPVVGVIDTQFNTEVYFNEWVEYHNMLDPDIPLQKSDYYHGTEVTSIIVDGPRGNPELDDGCGRFRVRHFGVATNGPFSSFSILRLIRDIVATNRDIKVWNLSLGSTKEVNPSFISPEAAELDRIQSEYDVLFVVAGTNRPKEEKKEKMRIGSPADSLNSLVVNSVAFNKKPASYTRVGPVLSFFHKPDVSYYGGDGPQYYDRIAVCRDSNGAIYASGTSLAAPWITRKMAYLICVMGLSREVAKALIIDAAAGWSRKDDPSNTIGYGVVPIHISEIIQSADDEIRFILSGTAEAYEAYTYNLPVPVVKDAHPYYARATLAYFPFCDRNQGVDYTSTEMDLHFGRLNTSKGRAVIKSINNNSQAEEGLRVIYEENARKLYRKWDNVKHISDVLKTRSVPRKAYDSGLWGLSIKTKERMQPQSKKSLPFGVVITLKEMNGVNRIEDFKKLCMARGWLVTKLDVQNQLDIYQHAEEEIKFE